MKAQIGVIGLGVMGSSLALNFAERGFRVAAFEIDPGRRERFALDAARHAGIGVHAALGEFVGALETPRRILMMVPAGAPVDALIESLAGLLDEHDILIDGGNSNYPDTERRVQALGARALRFVGMGISGGEEGARHGPSLMPGGDPLAWASIAPMFRAIAAQHAGEPCCAWMGSGGAGHFVKTVHNGIEYGDMQLICEAWQLLRDGLSLAEDAVAEIFGDWNRGELESYLVEITAAALRVRDADGTPRIRRILDSAEQKGTGRWSAGEALDLGVPLTLISAAVSARFLSARKAERVRAAARLRRSSAPAPVSAGIEAVREALYASKIVSYAQGFMLLGEASVTRNWQIPFADVARVWRAGCIIRSRFLDDVSAAFTENPGLENLLLADFFRVAMLRCEAGWRKALALGIAHAIPLPAMSAALAFFDGYRSAVLPANLLQAQRDFFGAHTYRRLDRDPAQRFHTRWSGDQQEQLIDG